MNSLLIALMLVTQTPKPISVSPPKDPSAVSYAKEISDILDNKCVRCHSTALAENKLILEDVKGMLKGGKKGPAIVSGMADASLLFQMAAHRVEPVMPPKDKKGAKPLTSEELGKLKAWIDLGAKDDTDTSDAPSPPISLGTLPPGVHPIYALDLSPDGNSVAVGRANVVSIFALSDGKELARLAGHKDLIQSVRYSKDGNRLFAGGFGEVIVWARTDAPKPAAPAEPKSEKKDAPLPKAEPKKADAKKPEPKKTETPKAETKPAAATPTQPKASVPETWKEVARIGPHVYRVLAIDISPDGKQLATAGGEPSKSGEIKIWSLPDGKLVRSLDGVHSDTVFAVKFSPDGKKLLTGSADRFVKLINIADGKELHSFEGHTHHVLSIDWKPDGKQFVTAGADGAVKFWDSESGEQLRSTQGTMKAFTGVRWAGDRPRVVASSADGTARDVTINSAQVSRTYSTNASPPDYLYTISGTADGQKVVGAGSEGVIYLWNGTNGQLLKKIEPNR